MWWPGSVSVAHVTIGKLTPGRAEYYLHTFHPPPHQSQSERGPEYCKRYWIISTSSVVAFLVTFL